MATQYTSLLGLALPVTGELSGNWGNVVNDSITSLLDSAISGTTSLTTDADTTLTTTTGAANQARQAIILWNPASGTVTRNITAPAQSKIYTVINASGGTQSIVFRGAGPTTGVTIVKGESAVVAWNGTDFIKISNAGGSASFTNVTVSGTTTLSGLTASTALALDASKNVVSVTNTGTGNNVLATSPTLVTPVLGTPTSVTLTNATGLPVATGISGLGTGVATALAVNVGTAGAPVINGGVLGTPSSGTVTNLTGTASININGTVGATTANTGAFTTLTTSGNVTLGDATTDTVTVNGYMGVGGAASSDAGLTLTSNALVGAAQSGLQIRPVGTSSATTSIRAIVGRADTAAASFTVADVMQIFAAGSTKGAGSTITNQHGLYIVDQAQGTNNFGITSLVSSGTNKWNIYASGTAANYFAGNVQFAAGSAAAPALTRFGDDNTGIFFPAADTIAFTEGGVEAMRITSAGNVGIGTSAPVGILNVLGSNASHGNTGIPTTPTLRLQRDTTGSANYAGLVINTNASNSDFGLYSNQSGALFYYGGIERMRIDASGNVGVGTSANLNAVVNTSVATAKAGISFHSSGAAGVTTGLMFNNNGAYGFIDYDPASSSGIRFSGLGPLRFGSNTNAAYGSSVFTEAMRITSAGNVGIGTSSPTAKLSVSGSSSSTLADITGAGDSFSLLVASGNAATVNSPMYSLDMSRSGSSNAKIDFNRGSGGTNGFLTFSTSGSERLRLDSSGNLGLGVTPSAWGGSFKAYEVIGGSFGSNSSADLYTLQNAYFNGTDFIYKFSFPATYARQTSGQHRWYIAPSGTAGNAISFTQAMTLNASGNLGIGTTSPATKLDVVGLEGILLGTDRSNSTDKYGIISTAHYTIAEEPFGVIVALASATDNIVNIGGGVSGRNTATQLRFLTAANSTTVTGTERMRIDSAGNLVQSAPTTPPSLATNGQMVFNLTSNTNLRVSVRGTDGVTRTANITLA